MKVPLLSLQNLSPCLTIPWTQNRQTATYYLKFRVRCNAPPLHLLFNGYEAIRRIMLILLTFASFHALILTVTIMQKLIFIFTTLIFCHYLLSCIKNVGVLLHQGKSSLLTFHQSYMTTIHCSYFYHFHI